MKDWFIQVWQKICDAFKTKVWLKWVALGVAAVLIASTVLVIALAGNDNRNTNSSSTESSSSASSDSLDSSSSPSQDSSDSSSQQPETDYMHFELSEDETYYTVKFVGTCKDLNLEIPAMHNNLPVTHIASGGFKGQVNLQSVVIPESITYIGSSAFEDCLLLETITMQPKRLDYLGNNAFNDTPFYQNQNNWEDGFLYLGNFLLAVKDVKGENAIKEGTTYIAGGAFADNTELRGITFPESLETIGAGAFYNCYLLFNVSFINYQGWVVSLDESFEDPIEVDSMVLLSNADKAAAKLLKETYLFYTWKRVA